MLKFLNFIEKKFMPPMTKLASNTYLKAIRTGMVVIIPLIIVGSFFLITLNIPIPGYSDFIAPYADTLVIPFRMTVYMMTVYATFGIGAALGRERGLDEITSGVLAMVAFFMSIVPLNGSLVPTLSESATSLTSADAISSGWHMSYAYLGSAGLFGSIIVSITSVEIFYFMKKKNITIKMPEQVPQSVSDSFAALWPTAVVVLLMFVITDVIGFNIHNFLNTIFMPLQGFLAGNNLIGMLSIVFLITLLWSAGIHGVSIIGGILRPFWMIAIEQNAQFVAGGGAMADIPNIGVEPFYQWFVWIGGAGGTVGLIIVCYFFAKSKYLKSITKVSLIPTIFNINEPVIFGFPIVMNPALVIPFIVGPLICTVVSYIAMTVNLVNAPSIIAPWTLPGPIGAFLSTGNDFMAIILCLVNIAILVIVYYPFVRIYDKQLLIEEGNAEV